MDSQELKQRLQGLKEIEIDGMRFVIRRINPLLDFPPDKMPNLFTEFFSDPRLVKKPIDETGLRKMIESMKIIVRAGMVAPELVPEEKHEEGVTLDDVFRNVSVGTRLYMEIMSHSLAVTKGMKTPFFSAGKRRWLSIIWRRLTDIFRRRSPIPRGSSV